MYQVFGADTYIDLSQVLAIGLITGVDESGKKEGAVKITFINQAEVVAVPESRSLKTARSSLKKLAAAIVEHRDA
jgi:hypothetical protein